MVFSKKHNVCFADDEHLAFYNEQSIRLNPDCCLKALVYALGICSDTRRRFNSIYNIKDKCIVPNTLHSEWQTGSSLKAMRLAFQLFTDSTPSVFLKPSAPDVDECKRYSVSDVFSCSLAPYFVEAIKLRYPDYMLLEKPQS